MKNRDASRSEQKRTTIEKLTRRGCCRSLDRQEVIVVTIARKKWNIIYGGDKSAGWEMMCGCGSNRPESRQSVTCRISHGDDRRFMPLEQCQSGGCQPVVYLNELIFFPLSPNHRSIDIIKLSRIFIFFISSTNTIYTYITTRIIGTEIL